MTPFLYAKSLRHFSSRIWHGDPSDVSGWWEAESRTLPPSLSSVTHTALSGPSLPWREQPSGLGSSNASKTNRLLNCSISPLTPVLHSHIQEILDFLPNDGLQFYAAPRDAGEIRPILQLTGFFLHLEPGQWLGNEGHSETGQREKVPDNFPWHWKNSTDKCTLFSPITQHKKKKHYHRTSQGFQPLRWALPERGCLDRNRCDNKWPLELLPKSCWPFPENCSSSWAPGFSLETLRSWHTTEKGQNQEK